MNLLHSYQIYNLPIKTLPLECIQHVSYMMKMHGSSKFIYIPTKMGVGYDSFIFNPKTQEVLSKIEFKFKIGNSLLGPGHLGRLKSKYSEIDIIDLGFKKANIFAKQQNYMLGDYAPYNLQNPIIKATDFSD